MAKPPIEHQATREVFLFFIIHEIPAFAGMTEKREPDQVGDDREDEGWQNTIGKKKYKSL